ncbi:MAG: M23 family metallopeptidase [Magnetovibrio sp.]|nr:M23 family metallopeptidase [Magnetovibrio sp.]
MSKFLSVFLICFCFASVTYGQGIGGQFIQPLKCTLGKDCWIPNYVDHQLGPGATDYACGKATYDAPPGAQHKGTDFAIRDLSVMQAGVEVLAAAPGTVVGVRDGVVDEKYSPKKHDKVRNRECGNAVRIEHVNGFTTQYCHLRKGSVRVRSGQKVQQGDILGFVGLSGQTAFPHLHFQVAQGKTIVDPFVGLSRKTSCGQGDWPLWDRSTLAALPYQPTAIYNAGFAPTQPNRDEMGKGTYRIYDTQPFPANAQALVVWVELFRVMVGDKVALTIHGPDGRVMHSQVAPIKADKAYQFYFTGKRLRHEAWPKGRYRGVFELRRNGEKIIAEREIEIR